MIAPIPAMQALLDTVPEGWRVWLFMVPTRIIRVIVDSSEKTFRVEQLMPLERTWRSLSTHTNATAWGAYLVAFEAACKAQQELIAGLKKKIEARNKLLPGLGGPSLAVPQKAIAVPQRRAAYDVRIK